MSEPDGAQKLLLEMLQMTDRELLKSGHYLKRACAVSVVLKDIDKANEFGRLAGELVNLIGRLEVMLKIIEFERSANHE